MPPRPRISRSARARSSRWKVRSRSPTTSAQRADLASAFRRYEDERRLEVLRLQNSARNSTEWFEDVERYLHLDPVQFNYSLLTRSQRISHENLRQRDPQWLAGAEKWFEQKATGADAECVAAADVRAVPCAWPRTGKPGLRLADGAVSRPRTAHRTTGISCITPSAPKAAPGWCSPK